MWYSGLYFIPTPGTSADASSKILAQITNSIESRFELASRQHQWTLLHRLLRSVPPPASTNAAQAQSMQYQHIVHLSYLSQSKTYCYIHPLQTSSTPNPQTAPSSQVKTEPTSNTPTPQPTQAQPSQTAIYTSATGTVISIPVSQSESHTSFLVNQLSPLWTFRHTLSLPQGLTYTVGQFTIHLGELRASRAGPTQSNQPISPGVVVCISTQAGASIEDEDDFHRMDSGYTSLGSNQEDQVVDLSGAEGAVRNCWSMIRQELEFGKTEVREVMMGKEGLQLKGEKEKEAVVRMWCEVLKLRG